MGFSQHHVKRVFFADAFMRQTVVFSPGSYDFFSETGKPWKSTGGWTIQFSRKKCQILFGHYLSVSGEMGYPELTFAFFFGDFGSVYVRVMTSYGNLPTWAGETKLCPHVLIQDLLEKLHLKTILFVQAIWLNHQPLRFVLAFKPNIAAEKRPFSLGWKPTPN